MAPPNRTDLIDQRDRIDELLEKTSRTFALSIPLLPQPTRRELGVAYLLFRIADTFEDAAAWTPPRQVDALANLARLLRQPSAEEAAQLGARWAAEAPIEHDGYLELLAETPRVLEALMALDAQAREIIVEHTIRTAQGMSGFVERTVDGALRLRDLDDLRQYCYVVAGIVGELSTELFLLGREHLRPVAGVLRSRATRFGEALQLVNILRDSAFDIREGRSYLPVSIRLDMVTELAREDLRFASEYTLALQDAGGPRGLVGFCALPIRLANATLELVQREGAGAKIGRAEVYAIVASLNEALDRGEPAVRVPQAVS